MGKRRRRSGMTFLEVIYKDKSGKERTAEFETDIAPLSRAVSWARKIVQENCSEIIDIFELQEESEEEEEI